MTKHIIESVRKNVQVFKNEKQAGDSRKVLTMTNERKVAVIHAIEIQIEKMDRDHQWSHEPSMYWDETEMAAKDACDNRFHELVDMLNSIRYDRVLLRPGASAAARSLYPLVPEEVWKKAEKSLSRVL